MAILRAPAGFYAWARSDRCVRLLARLSDRTSLGVVDDNNLRLCCSVQAATITICRVRAGLYVHTCTGWPTRMPLLPVTVSILGNMNGSNSASAIVSTRVISRLEFSGR